MTYTHKKLHALFIVLFSTALILSCHNYYKATKARIASTPRVASVVDSLHDQHRYFVLRNGSRAYYMSNFTLSNDRTKLTTTLDYLPEEHRLHLRKGHRNHNMQYKSGTDEAMVLNEVHLYIKDDTLAQSGSYTLMLDQVQKIEVIQ